MAKQSPINVVDSAPYTSPLADELVIKTKAIALNPSDVVVQKLGILLEDYPAILGCDVAGEVVEVHSSLADAYNIGGSRHWRSHMLGKRKTGSTVTRPFKNL